MGAGQGSVFIYLYRSEWLQYIKVIAVLLTLKVREIDSDAWGSASQVLHFKFNFMMPKSKQLTVLENNRFFSSIFISLLLFLLFKQKQM